MENVRLLYILRWLEESGVECLVACTGYPAEKLDAPFLDIGTPESYAKAEAILPKLPGPAGAGAGNN
jgi:NDP-sugar pyrophosphorylase family protein